MKKYLLLVVGILLVGMVLPKSAGAVAFGISPPFIHATHLVPGVRYSQTIYLVRDDESFDVGISVDMSFISKAVRDWITFKPGDQKPQKYENFIIPKGVRQFPVDIIIKVPKDSGPRDYTGKIRFVTGSSGTEGGGQVAITYGMQLVVNITVGDEIYRELKAYADILDIEEGWSPRASVKLDNKGNVPESFDRATYQLFDKFKAVRLAYIQKSQDFPEIPPFSMKEYVVEFPIDLHLGIGDYWGDVNFYQGNTLLAGKETVFKVLEKGSLSRPLAREFYYLGGAVALGAGFFISFFIRKKLKSRSG